mmetsp:Transcript_45185/g.50293  ORF Transcript_45185/g.50293 Transcript_45185/m.50293 type:complete len:83 (+) Transcript_45185:751-999(+)
MKQRSSYQRVMNHRQVEWQHKHVKQRSYQRVMNQRQMEWQHEEEEVEVNQEVKLLSVGLHAEIKKGRKTKIEFIIVILNSKL